MSNNDDEEPVDSFELGKVVLFEKLIVMLAKIKGISLDTPGRFGELTANSHLQSSDIEKLLISVYKNRDRKTPTERVLAKLRAKERREYARLLRDLPPRMGRIKKMIDKLYE